MSATIKNLDQLRGVSITEVIGHYIKLKRAGTSATACCPFHNERSASFHVSEVKGIYKCFGCGAGGDAIRFVMEHERLSFFDACKTVAGITSTPIELEEREPTEKEKTKATAAELQEQVLNFVVPIYRQNLFNLPDDHPAKKFLYDRGYTDEVIADWQLGWGGEEWHFITPQIIEKGWYEPATQLGLIKTKEGSSNTFDVYRSRIIIPIIDRLGRYVGISGRFVVADEADRGVYDKAKYINSRDCELYNKSNVLFGLHKAAAAIKEKKCAVVVEGNFDVIAPHTRGLENVVGMSGTAFTQAQMNILKKHTNSLSMMFDNDQAGVDAFQRALPDLLQQGFYVSRIRYEGKDPDEWLQVQQGDVEFPASEDALLFYAAGMWNKSVEIHAKADAKQAILEMVAKIPNEFVRNQYIDNLVATYKWHKSETKAQFSKIAEAKGDARESDEDLGSVKLPEWLNNEQKEEFLQNGYVPVNRKVNGKPLVGYFSFNQNGKIEITNFVVVPLFHVYAGVESRYLLQIYNGYRNAVLDVPAKAIPAIDQFQAFTVSEGNFLIFGQKSNWLRIASDLLQKFPRCVEIKNLGWQPFNFFSFVDKIYVPGEGLKELDNWGIYKTKEETNYLIPASCEAYKQLQHTGEDPFENDRHLTYKESPVSFSRWAQQMQRVYGHKGVVGVAGVILSLFRDIVFSIDNNCPHLYAFGEPSSGKSKWAESITSVFFHKRSAFNLNSGTDFAFFSFMQKYNNTPAHLNEFEIEVIKPEWFQAIKGVYDGEGRERGKGGSKNRTEIMKVRSMLVLTGQKLITADDNSVVTRSLIEPFSVRDNITEEDKIAYNELKDWEAKGLSSMLVELLKHRSEIETKYKTYFNNLLSQWRRESPEARNSNQRILQNYAHLATGYRLISEHMQLPETADEFTTYCLKGAIRWSLFIRSSDTLSEFWRTLEFLADQQSITDGWDYSIEEVMEVKVRRSKEEHTIHFDQPTKVMFLRLNNVHKLFQATYRTRTGKEAMNMENLLHYFSSRKYFIGNVKSKRFKRFVTTSEERRYGQGGSQVATEKKPQESISSCYAFLYEELNIEIERFDGSTDPEHHNQLQLVEMPTDELPF